LHRERHEVKAALADFEAGLGAEPNDSRSTIQADNYAERGRILHVARKYAEALADYETALRIRPDFADVYRLRAEALVERQRPNAAADSFDEYLKRGGKPSADFYQACGQARARLRDYSGAIADYTKALKLSPNSTTYAARGWVHLVTHADTEALRDFDQAIGRDDKNGDAYNGRGFLLAKLSQYKAAGEDARKAFKYAPRKARNLWNTARIHAEIVGRIDADRQQLGRFSTTRVNHQFQAVQLLSQALEMTPSAEQASFWQGKIQKDEVFDPIRGSSEYRELSRKYAGLTR
jgi:tetratricopeptide (TPR) repeat protein